MFYMPLYTKAESFNSCFKYIFPKWDSYHIHESSPGGITTQLLIKTAKTIHTLNTLKTILSANTFKGLDART